MSRIGFQRSIADFCAIFAPGCSNVAPRLDRSQVGALCMTLGVSHAAATKTLTRVAKIALDYNSKILITRKKIRTTMATGVG